MGPSHQRAKERGEKGSAHAPGPRELLGRGGGVGRARGGRKRGEGCWAERELGWALAGVFPLFFFSIFLFCFVKPFKIEFLRGTKFQPTEISTKIKYPST